ncbi:drug metabolite transporter, putative [Plasmodium chabaudi chabaudi]|uniref:Drug metabolite transporter, putative n=1 Tax=Plasmodium chabaudi chabaudi TaxID=31271 RepID=A0A1C6YRZ8_PLACU|nr:drug metabolite transporter, putative [Plasmodium chabaudi chabaudi]SCN62940.1 drug metabolite transporter, putative [Plasmodium chabaudi chabaudi]
MKYMNIDLFSKCHQNEEGARAVLVVINLMLMFSMFLYGINYILMKYYLMINGSVYVFTTLRTLLTLPFLFYIYLSKKSEPKKKKLLHNVNEMYNERIGNNYNADINSIKKKTNNNIKVSDNKKGKTNKNSSNQKNEENNEVVLNLENSDSCCFSKITNNDEKLIPRSAYIPLIILSVASAIRQLIVIIALQYTDSHNAAIIQPTIPIFTALMSYYLRIEKLNFMSFLAILLSFIGLGITVEIWNLKSFDFGFLLLLTVPFTKGLQVIYINVAAKYVSNDIIQFCQMAMLLVISLPYGILGEMFVNNNYNIIKEMYNLTRHQFICIVYSAIALIYISWKIQIVALNYLTPVTVSLYQSLQPVFTFVLARIFLNEIINYNKYIGTVFIIISLIIYQRGYETCEKV